MNSVDIDLEKYIIKHNKNLKKVTVTTKDPLLSSKIFTSLKNSSNLPDRVKENIFEVSSITKPKFSHGYNKIDTFIEVQW